MEPGPWQASQPTLISDQVVWYVAVLSIAAMLSKENGLTVPAFAAIYAWITRQPRLVSVSLLVIAGYLALRFAVFGASAASSG